MTFPIVVSFYTADTPYEDEVQRLIASCDTFGLETYIEAVPSSRLWVENCAKKGPFLLHCLEHFKQPVLWLDADAEVIQYPTLFETLACDIAVYRPDGKLLSGTLYLEPTDAGMKLANTWARLCQRHPRQWDQNLLRRVVDSTEGLALIQLPQGYCKIFDFPWRRGESRTAFVVHHQASRRFKREINKSSQ